MTERRLIVTADDFGASAEVNEAVERAHREGVLTAASLMVAAPFADDAVARARRMPTLGVGLHFVLVEGRPLLPPEKVPDLVDQDGLFRTDMARMGAAIFFRPAVRRQLRREVEAQFVAFAATGLALDHVNAHKHFHLHPTILSEVMRIGQRYGLRGARAPVEPGGTLATIEPGAGGFNVAAPWARLVRLRLQRARVTAPDQVFGLAWSGAMTTDRLRGLVRHLPPGLTEFYLHPATAGGWTGAAQGYRYAEEFAALLDAEVRDALRERGVRLGRFADFINQDAA